MIIFNGNQLAQNREEQLKQRVFYDFAGEKLVIAAVLFKEDAGSRLYTKLKSEAAARVGIGYHSYEFSLSDSIKTIQTKIEELNSNPQITGIIIQKPWRKTWVQAKSAQLQSLQPSFIQNENSSTNFATQDITINTKDGTKEDIDKNTQRKQFAIWWEKLTTTILESKDVDGLHPNTIQNIKNGTWVKNGTVLPATCQAVLTILEEAELQLKKESGNQNFTKGKYLVLGKSDLLGIPLFYELQRQEKDVEILASKELQERMLSRQKLLDGAVVISATGRKNLVTGDMVSQNVVVIDVGEPRADVEFTSVSQKASFITPVPGGVGPMTVVSLLENCMKLASKEI